jgi:CHAT domain-containing protein
MNGSLKKLAVAVLLTLVACRGDSPAERMRTIAPRAGRTVEARLTGFPWSPMRVQRGRSTEPLDPARLELAGAAGAVIQKTPAGHDAGVGYLVIDRDADAVDALQEAARKSPNDAKIWSDLAAARYTFAVRGDRPYELPRALAAADRAIRIKPDLADALFNRALIIEKLGIGEAARRAWQRYLQVDGTSRWATEAMQHLGRLRVVAVDQEFKRDLAQASAALRTGDAVPMGALTRAYPQEARKWGEGPLLAEWADAVRADNQTKAKETLDVVRAIGRALADWNHEQLLADTVAAIDAAPPESAAAMAEAQAVYRDARILYAKRKVAEAHPMLERAAEMFARAKSPMALSASYYAANALSDANRSAEAAQRLERLLGTFDRQRYRALHAHVLWQLSICAQAAGDWETAIRSAAEAVGVFTSLGETLNRGESGTLLANALDRSAQPRAAWTALVSAFVALSEGKPDRIRGALTSAIRCESERGSYDSALALSDLLLHDLQQEREPHAAFIFANRARLLAAAGDPARARAAVADARAAAAQVADPGLRERSGILTDVVEGSVVRAADPRASLQLLNRAHDFFSSRNERAYLPDIFLQRGRTYLAAGDSRAALAEFERGIEELDALRSRFEDSSLRSGFYDSGADLFPEAIGVLLELGDVERAFAVADGARARSVHERRTTDAKPAASRAASVAAALSDDEALLEYAILADRLAIFTAGRAGVAVDVVRIDPGELRRDVAHLADLLQRRADLPGIDAAVARLSEPLLRPVAQRIGAARRLIIVPDRHLHSVPFAALRNPLNGRRLVEDLTIVIAPNAAARTYPAHPRSDVALVVGDPTSAGTAPLPEAVQEAQAIAAMYRSATVLLGDGATRSRFVNAARTSGIIHYAGHARSDARSSFGSLRLAGDENVRSGDLEATDIAHMPLESAPLVVLAACGTIRGDADHVEGMPSVARAFLAAGARGVVGTLWEIDDDAAAQLFRRFHQQLSRGASPSAALRAAQLELLRSGDPRLQHPSTWAPVEVLGGYEPAAPPPPQLMTERRTS